MKMLHFVDAATTDERFVAAEEVKQIVVTDADSVIVYLDSLDPAVTANDSVDITCTAASHTVSLRLAEFIAHGKNDVLTVKATTAPFTEASAVAYTAGS